MRITEKWAFTFKNPSHVKFYNYNIILQLQYIYIIVVKSLKGHTSTKRHKFGVIV